VRARTAEQRVRLAAPVAQHVIAGEPLRSAAVRGATIPETLRELPGMLVHYGTFETVGGREMGACVESRRSMPRLVRPPRRYPDIPWCDAVTVVLDGVVIPRPVEFFKSARLDQMESIEYLSPLGAATRWGLEASATGAIVLWTRGHGPHVNRKGP
jgi:hypothetical protein